METQRLILSHFVYPIQGRASLRTRNEEGAFENMKDLIGEKFGEWVVESYSHKTLGKHYWICRCSCGARFKVYSYSLVSGRSSMCIKCSNSGSNNGRFSHGETQTRLHYIWRGILASCSQTTNRQFPNYGGRGIKVCQRWRNSFTSFKEDMGPRPSPNHSVDRIDNEKGYNPKNCRWATRQEQNQNTRANHYLELNGVRLCITEWGRRTGIGRGTIAARVGHLNWSIEKALTTPLRGMVLPHSEEKEPQETFPN